MKKIVGIFSLGVFLSVTLHAGVFKFVKGLVVRKKKMRIGMTVQDLRNPIWSGGAAKIKELVEKDGGSMTSLDCKNNVDLQIQQIENFIAGEIDAMIVQPVEVSKIEPELAKAREAGIKIYSWDENMKNADVSWLIDNYTLGKTIGEQTAKWINEKLGGEAEIAILDYPEIPILLDRGKGIVDAIKRNAPNAKIVAQTSAINPTEGMTKVEDILQTHPNVKVIACIGGGGAVGANEAVKFAGRLTPDFGIFACDAVDQELEAIKNNEAERSTIMITGGGDRVGEVIYGWLKKLVSGEDVPSKIYRELIPITIDNVDEYVKK